MELQVLADTLLNMVAFVALVALLLYLVSKSRRAVNLLAGETVKGFEVLPVITTLGILIMLASHFAPIVAGAKSNVRDSIAIFAAIIGEPVAGVAVGLI